MATLIVVLGSLSAEAATMPCTAVHIPTRWSGREEWLRRCSVASIPLFGAGDQRFSPTNFWPDDLSWFVYTDYDLCATKVAGSPTLVNSLISSGEIETYKVPETDEDAAAEILLDFWDVLVVRESDVSPEAEYRFEATGAVALLRSGADRDELLAFLAERRRDLGSTIPGSPYDLAAADALMRSWRARTQPAEP